MRRKGILAAAVIIVALTVVVMISRGKMPYQDLKASEVVSAAVRLSPPDETVPIADVEELVSLLKEVVIYREDNSYTEYSGQAVTFALTMADGSQGGDHSIQSVPHRQRHRISGKVRAL